ncbi:MAG: lysophospholipid acyltransferase family protein [Elusimicrobia bacterium]|nr:lysophospholipid acyltransferase family protein [Elusimicrobiota bacterium]
MYPILKRLYKSKAVRFVRHLALAGFLVVLLAVIALLPYRISLALGRLLGWLACYTAAGYRKKVDSNLREAFGHLPQESIKSIREETFMNIGMNLVEFGMLNFRPADFWRNKIDLEGKDILDRYLDGGKGIILLSAHIGNWELLGAYLAMAGYPVNVVAREIYDKRLDLLLVSLRSRRRVNTIYRHGRANMKKMVAAVKRKELLGILIDQDTSVGGVYVEFFGKPAYTPTAVSQFARIRNSVVLPAFIYRKSDMKHQVVIMEAVGGGADIAAETQEYTKIIEDFIRNHPAQWVWMHPRWKKKK